LQDAKWPMRAAIIAFVVNLVFSLALMYPMKHKGLALANSLSAVFNVFILSFVLRKKIGKFLDRSFYMSVFKIILSSIIMVGSIMIIDYFMPWNIYADFKMKLVYLISTVMIGAGVFFVSAYLLKSQEITSLINMMKTKLDHSMN
jgi:putative peptidoglycan lipid II flippase